MIRSFFVVNAQGRVKFLKDFDQKSCATKDWLSQIVRRALENRPEACSFWTSGDTKFISRSYNGLLYVCGVDDGENELIIFELINVFVEAMRRYFGGISELDILFNIDKAYMILDEMVTSGDIVETRIPKILDPIYYISKTK